MARSYRYSSEDNSYSNLYSTTPECDDCGNPAVGGSYVQDADGFTAFLCRPCGRTITATITATLVWAA